MNQPLQIRSGTLYQAAKPIRDAEYRRFIKSLPCVGCLKTWWIDPCHTGPHGIGQKACDLTCIPLCRRCHQAFDANPQKFAEFHKLDIPALIEMFQHFYQTKLGGKAGEHVWAIVYVAMLLERQGNSVRDPSKTFYQEAEEEADRAREAWFKRVNEGITT